MQNERKDDPWVHPEKCRRMMEEGDQKFETLSAQIQTLSNQLIKDNGHKSVQTCLVELGNAITVQARDMSRMEHIIAWFAGATMLTMLGIIGYLFALHFGK